MPIGKARLKISDYRDERKRKTANSERRIRVVSLSLTSMVDMFAILVIFLLTNTDTVSQWIEVSQAVQLPKAHHVESPSQGQTITLSTNGLWLGPEKIETERLGARLKEFSKDTMLNVVAHEELPYGDIKKLLSSCQSAGFEKINLAVQPISK